jgi:ketosteroid isomerase-like protein
MQTDTNAENATVAIALSGVVVRGERDRLAEAASPGLEGARAALDTFYHALNTRSLNLLLRTWADDPLVQLDNPLGGIVRGLAGVAALYGRILSGPVRAQVTLEDIVAYVTPELLVFAGREVGSYEQSGVSEPLAIRTSRIFRFLPAQGGWRQIHHHGSLDDPDQLARYQRAVRGG